MSTANILNQVSDAGNGYRYKRFTTSLLMRDLRFGKDAAGPGDSFPSFEIVTTSGDRLVNHDVFGDKPVLVIFGSMTCPMTASAAPSVQELYDDFGDRVKFIMLYVREAHPGEQISQAETMEEKVAHAKTLKEFYNINWTVAVDDIDGDLHRALDPKPNSAFLMDDSGKIIFRSLWAADRDALRQALDAAAAGRVPARKQSDALIGPVTRAMGQVQEVMTRGGPQAVRDLWRAGFPMALAGRVATFFTPLSPDQRGVAAVLTLMLGMLVVLGILGAWVLA
jgi:thiol-disulfide isomerase/thioredoxin